MSEPIRVVDASGEPVVLYAPTYAAALVDAGALFAGEDVGGAKAPPAPAPADMLAGTVADLIGRLPAISDPALLADMLAQETRKGAQRAITARIAEIGE